MPDERLPHLMVVAPPKTERFVSTQAGGGKPRLKNQDRQSHGAKLQADLAAIATPLAPGEVRPRGVALEFRSEPGLDLIVKSLESERIGIELLGVKTVDLVTIATVYVPDGQLTYFEKRIAARAQDGRRRRHAPRARRRDERPARNRAGNALRLRGVGPAGAGAHRGARRVLHEERQPTTESRRDVGRSERGSREVGGK